MLKMRFQVSCISTMQPLYRRVAHVNSAQKNLALSLSNITDLGCILFAIGVVTYAYGSSPGCAQNTSQVEAVSFSQ